MYTSEDNLSTKNNQPNTKELTHSIELQDSGTIWIITCKEIFIAYAWPLTFIIIVLIFYKQFKQIFESIGAFLKEIIEINIEKYGIKMTRTGTHEVGEQKFKLDSDSISSLTSESIIKDGYINKILSTLWHYQQMHSADFSKRWTFTLGAKNPEYSCFINSIISLINLGLVTQDRDSQQFFLTDFGIVFCKNNAAKLSGEKFSF